MGDVTSLREYTTPPPVTGCGEPFLSTFLELLQSAGRAQPQTTEEAKDTLQWLTHHFH